MKRTCQFCDGTGDEYYSGATCAVCKGTGVVNIETKPVPDPPKKVRVEMPAEWGAMVGEALAQAWRDGGVFVPMSLSPAERVFLIRLLQASGPSPEQQTILEKLKP